MKKIIAVFLVMFCFLTAKAFSFECKVGTYNEKDNNKKITINNTSELYNHIKNESSNFPVEKDKEVTRYGSCIEDGILYFFRIDYKDTKKT